MPIEGENILSAIAGIPVELDEPEVQSQLAWELMWSDPVRLVLSVFFSLDCLDETGYSWRGMREVGLSRGEQDLW